LEFLLFLATLSRRVLTLGKSISLAIGNDLDDMLQLLLLFSLGLGGILIASL
jgi:hypothetical protein